MDTAFGYIRCGLPDEWLDYYVSLDSRFPSRSAGNPWYNEQRRLIRPFVHEAGFESPKCFFEVEGTPEKPIDPIPISRRAELAKLFVEVTSRGNGVVVVDVGDRLDENHLVRALLCQFFFECYVPRHRRSVCR
jgi:hypothetical protein